MAASESDADVPLSAPTDILETLTELLGTTAATKPKTEEQWAKLPWENNPTLQSEPQASGESTAEESEEMSNGCDFSSFPSLSLQKKSSGGIEDAHDLFPHKDGIEAHVASLLSRPILVSNDQEKRCETEDEDEDGVSEFVEDSIATVPRLMQQNLVLSFSTLVQSRIRAYATFLARHGLSLAATSEPRQDVEDGVVGVEQKLEMLLELGNLVALGDVQTSFLGQPQEVNITTDEGELKANMPLNLKASISVIIPTVEGTPEYITMILNTSGSIAGIFTKDTANPLLRVVQVDLNMPQLLSSMKEAAASTVSRIVEITNATYSVPLPRVLSIDFESRPVAVPPVYREDNLSSNKKRPHTIEEDCGIITPDLGSKPVAKNPSDLDLVDLEDLSALSPDKCVKIVDSLFDKIDVRVLSPPGKRARFSPGDDVDAIALTLPVV